MVYLIPERQEAYGYDKAGNRWSETITQAAMESRESAHGEYKNLRTH